MEDKGMKVTLILPAIGKKTGQKYLRSWLMEPLTVAVLNAMIPDRYERVFFDRLMALGISAPISNRVS